MKSKKRKTIPIAVRKIVYQKYGGRCAYCGCELEYKDMQVDHIISVYWHNGGNEIENLMPTCRMCNFYKSTYSIEQFRDQLQALNARLNKVFIYRLAKKYGIIEERKEAILFYFEKSEIEEGL